jgi:hypothetical protein
LEKKKMTHCFKEEVKKKKKHSSCRDSHYNKTIILALPSPVVPVVTRPNIIFASSEPQSFVSPAPVFATVTTTETPITSVSISPTALGASSIELRGLIGWSMVIQGLNNGTVIIWRIRRQLGITGTIIWSSNDGIGVDDGEDFASQSNILHVDNVTTTTLPSTKVYQLTAQIDAGAILNPGTVSINGPVVFNTTLYPR